MVAGPCAGDVEKANALVENWYLGQEGGTAMADMLFGDVNPGGKLPVTVVRNLSPDDGPVSSQRLGLAALTGKLDAVSVVDEAVEDGVFAVHGAGGGDAGGRHTAAIPRGTQRPASRDRARAAIASDSSCPNSWISPGNCGKSFSTRSRPIGP